MANQLRKPEQRPSPDARLEAARREEGRVGKLRIFVGTAPGVGKTYEMLQSARARAKTAMTSLSESLRPMAATIRLPVPAHVKRLDTAA